MSTETEAYQRDYRPAKLEQGARYQDFIMERLHRIGVVVQMYSSKEGQRKGENMLGLEIKNDSKLHETGNLCIETAEKAHPRPGDYWPSGIFRNDNSWLYGLGTYQVFFIFAKSTLLNCYELREKMGFRDYIKPTSKGFLIPVCRAERLRALKLVFDFSGNIKAVESRGDYAPLDLTAIETPADFQLRLGI